MTTEQRQLYVAIATAVFNILMLFSGLTFAAQYSEYLMAAASVVSIIAASFLGVKLNGVVNEQKARDAFNLKAQQAEEDELGEF